MVEAVVVVHILHLVLQQEALAARVVVVPEET